MSVKSIPLPHVVANFHIKTIESAFTDAGREADAVREILLGRGYISFLFDKGDTRGAVTIDSPAPLNLLSVWNTHFAPLPAKKAKGLGLDRVA